MCETERQAEMELIEFLKFTEQDDSEKYNMLQQSACEIRVLEKENQQLKKQNARLTREVCNRLITNYDYSSTLKDELNKERINNIVLKEVIEKISNNILNETTTFCESCASKDCCPEEDCVLYRIEKLVDKDSYK